jgi:anti-sigma B factor antagonist
MKTPQFGATLMAMQPPKLEISGQPNASGSLVMVLRGRLSLETVGMFLQELRTRDAQKLILDMSEVSYLDSAGVGALVQLFVHRRGRSQKLALAALTRQGSAVIQVAGLVKLIPSFLTAEEASASL